MNIIAKVDKTGIPAEEIKALRPQAGQALDRLWSGNEPMTGWVTLPVTRNEKELQTIQEIAEIIKDEAELLVVIGIGGSYMGAKAAIEALPKAASGIEVRFMGNNLCTDYYFETLEAIKEKNTILCVISKSGNTMQVRMAFEVVKPIMVENVEWGGHWRVIIGLDTMGTDDNISDDVLIMVDPFDTTDHNQDGYALDSVDRFFSMWFDHNMLPKGERNQPWLVAVPK